MERLTSNRSRELDAPHQRSGSRPLSDLKTDSRENFLNEIAVDVRQSKVSALVLVRQSFVIDSQ